MRLRNYRVKEGFLKGIAQSRLDIIVVSSVYCESLHSTLAILIPRTFSSFLTALAKTSAHRIKRKGRAAERASLSHSATRRKDLRRPIIVLDTTAYIRVK